MGEANKKRFRDFNQKMRYSDADLLLLKYHFAETDDLLYIIRKVFLQFELDAEEQKAVQGLSQEILALIKKEMIPELDGNVPFHQMQDLFNVVNFQEPDVQKIYAEIISRQAEKKYLEQQFAILSGQSKKQDMLLKELLPNRDYVMAEMLGVMINLSTRNLIVRHVDTQLGVFKILAGQSTETVEQTKERLSKDSNR